MTSTRLNEDFDEDSMFDENIEESTSEYDADYLRDPLLNNKYLRDPVVNREAAISSRVQNSVLESKSAIRTDDALKGHFNSEYFRRFREEASAVDAQLSRYLPVTQIASAVGLRPLWVAVAAVALLSIFFGVFDSLITTLVGLLYPAWQTFKALEAPHSGDGQQWLCYWICFTAFSFIEVFSDFLLFWMPLYYIVKVAFLLWLFLPQFKGATILYAYVLRPLLLQHQGNIDNVLHSTQNILSAAQVAAQHELRKHRVRRIRNLHLQ